MQSSLKVSLSRWHLAGQHMRDNVCGLMQCSSFLTCVAPLATSVCSMRRSSPVPQSPRSTMLGACTSQPTQPVRIAVQTASLAKSRKLPHAHPPSKAVVQGTSAAEPVLLLERRSNKAATAFRTQPFGITRLALVPALHALRVVAGADLGGHGAPVHIVQHHPLVLCLVLRHRNTDYLRQLRKRDAETRVALALAHDEPESTRRWTVSDPLCGRRRWAACSPRTGDAAHRTNCMGTHALSHLAGGAGGLLQVSCNSALPQSPNKQ